MDAAVVWILAAAAVPGCALFALKGLLDQLPDLFRAWRKARRAWHGDDPRP
ncbi:hypothetical protein ACH4U6_08645 [Streptomyces netropsis]|uniref:hypothetical protein n=1 Tax=Streptomyces netropsis TaxID=55404 RepID=UPI0037BB4538